MRESAKTTRNQLKVMRERSMWCCPKCAVSRGSFSDRRSRSTRWSTWKAAETCHTCCLPLRLLFGPQRSIRSELLGWASCTRGVLCLCVCVCTRAHVPVAGAVASPWLPAQVEYPGRTTGFGMCLVMGKSMAPPLSQRPWQSRQSVSCSGTESQEHLFWASDPYWPTLGVRA